jgi:ribulose-phosphate 3-epimerase
MIENPERYVSAFAQAGADSISVHLEACHHLDGVLEQIRADGAQAGVVLNPATPVAALENAIEVADYVLLMSVNPGFGGQEFIPYVLEKVGQLCQMRQRKRKPEMPIEIDGGVHLDNLAEVVRAGCDWIVTGSAIFHSRDAEATVRQMRDIAANALAVKV